MIGARTQERPRQEDYEDGVYYTVRRRHPNLCFTSVPYRGRIRICDSAARKIYDYDDICVSLAASALALDSYKTREY